MSETVLSWLNFLIINIHFYNFNMNMHNKQMHIFFRQMLISSAEKSLNFRNLMVFTHYFMVNVRVLQSML